jgi:hypothetical protein
LKYIHPHVSSRTDYKTSAPAMIQTTRAKGATIPALETPGGNHIPTTLRTTRRAVVAFATTELKLAAILDAPLPLNVANCCDTLDETMLALTLAMLAMLDILTLALLADTEILD